MSDIERLTITLTPEIAQTVRAAVATGDYASSSEIVREALRDWKHKRLLQQRELAELRNAIEAGLDDVKTGRVKDFDANRIIKKGEQRLSKNASSE